MALGGLASGASCTYSAPVESVVCVLQTRASESLFSLEPSLVASFRIAQGSLQFDIKADE